MAALAVGLIAVVGSGVCVLPAAGCDVEPVAAERICPNTAPPASLMRLPGIGRVRASDIVAGRDIQPFANADQMQRIRGIGPKTVEKIKPFLMFEDRK